MEKAQHLVALKRQVAGLTTEATALGVQIERLNDELLAHMEAGEFPSSSKVAGATVYLRSDVWAGPADGDHAALTAALESMGYDDLTPKTVNSSRLSAWVREHLDDDTTKAIEDRLTTLDPAIRPFIKVTEKQSVRINGL